MQQQARSLFVAALLLCAAALCTPAHAVGAQRALHADDALGGVLRSLQQNTAGEACKVRIALVNAVPFHFEVVGGFLHVLRDYKACIDVYFQHQYFTHEPMYHPWWHDMTFGYQALITEWQPQIHYASTHDKVWPADAALFISPEFNMDYYRHFLSKARPARVVAVLHEPYIAGRVAQLNAIAPNATWIMLSPHAAHHLQRFILHDARRIDWVLPIRPYRPAAGNATECARRMWIAPSWRDVDPGCMRGFAIQGKFDPHRRNYKGLWAQMQALLSDPKARRVTGDPAIRAQLQITAVGQGRRELLGVPPGPLQELVTARANLTFPAFYELLARNVAMLTLFGERSYLQSKISSSVVSSLVTGTPLIADAAFLRSYKFFTKHDIVLQRPGETEVDAMLRILAAPPAEVMKVRASIEESRAALNARALTLLQQLLALPPLPHRERAAAEKVAAEASASRATTLDSLHTQSRKEALAGGGGGGATSSSGRGVADGDVSVSRTQRRRSLGAGGDADR